MFLSHIFILVSEFRSVCSYVNLNCTDFTVYSFHRIKSVVYEHFAVSDFSFFLSCLFVVVVVCISA